MAASFLFASSLGENSSKHGRIDRLARFGRLRPECFSTLLCQIQAARGGTERPLQAHSTSPIPVSRTRWSRAADPVAALYPAHRLYPYALVLLPSGAQRGGSDGGPLWRSLS